MPWNYSHTYGYIPEPSTYPNAIISTMRANGISQPAVDFAHPTPMRSNYGNSTAFNMESYLHNHTGV
jgi:hypothetical protein